MNLEHIEEKIDSFATDLILLDFSSEEELKEFLDSFISLKDLLQDPVVKPLEQIFSITQEHLKNVDRKEESLNKFLTHVISFLQNLIKDMQSNANVSDHVGRFEAEIKMLVYGKESTEGQSSAPIKLTETQETMLPEFISDALSLLEEIEGDLLDLETQESDPEKINKLFRAFHTLKGESNLLGLIDLGNMAHKAEDMLEKLRSNAFAIDGDIISLLLKVLDVIKKYLAGFSEGRQTVVVAFSPIMMALENILQQRLNNKEPDQDILDKALEEDQKPIGEILIEEGSITQEELDVALTEQREQKPDKRVGEILQEKNSVSAKDVKKAIKIQKGVMDTSIKIKVDKLDALIELVGELVITETQVVQNPIVLGIDNRRVVKDLAELDRITRRLQEISMGMRLVPVRPTFQKMVRIIRDLSRKSNKDIDVTLLGEDTEIDKNMVEMISDPFVHMVRNSVDHGIESKEDRVANGKSSTGYIKLAAFHKGGNVIVEIHDDGAGLDVERILQKAMEKGLVKDGDNFPKNRICNLIFEPGFSTAEQVTDVSGRGVGMDVVKRNIEQLRGKIEISTEKGKGSVFSIQLPLTLAIIEGIVLMVGGESYILPISSIIEFVQPLKKNLTNIASKGHVYKVHEGVYPLIYLNHYFKLEAGVEFESSTICLVESDFGRVCLMVDELLGQQQVVIKSLGERLTNVKGISGGAILGDGHVGLILDINGIVELAQKGLV